MTPHTRKTIVKSVHYLPILGCVCVFQIGFREKGRAFIWRILRKKSSKKAPQRTKVAQRTTSLLKEYPNSPLGGGNTFVNTVKNGKYVRRSVEAFFFWSFFWIFEVFSRNPSSRVPESLETI